MEWIRYILREKRFDIWLAILLAFVAAVVAEAIVELLIFWGIIPVDVLDGLRAAFTQVGQLVVRYPLCAAVVMVGSLSRWLAVEMALRRKQAHKVPKSDHQAPLRTTDEAPTNTDRSPIEPKQPRWVTPVLWIMLLFSFGVLVQLRVAHADPGHSKVTEHVEKMDRTIPLPDCSEGPEACGSMQAPGQPDLTRSASGSDGTRDLPIGTEEELEGLVIEHFINTN